MGILISRQSPALCTTWCVSEPLQNVLRDFHTGRSSSVSTTGSSRLKIGRGTSGKTSFNTPEGAHGEPFIASRSSIVVGSGIAFTALDLITRGSPFRATMCPSVRNVFPSTFPGATSPHETSWNLASHSEHHRSSKRQELSSMWTFLQPLIRRFSITRHMTFVQQSTETPANEQRWDSRHDSKDQKEALLSSPRLI